VAVSGGFDPLRLGHLHLLKSASMLGDYLKVILTRDKQLIMKKGYAFMPYLERKEILENNKYVNEVVENIDADLSSCKSLVKYQPNIYARGGDRLPKERWVESNVCRNFGIEMIEGVGGFDKESSSSELTGGKHRRKLIGYCDVDGILAFTNRNDYKNSRPNLEAIAKLNKYYDDGYTINIWTARGSTSHMDWRDLTERQLKEWGVKYHKLIMGKPSFDILWEDKARREL
jgi:D-beta-D-heptose 7-phosphate kinase/D-beta-D-heptose 1-phosphate adenosyltransferase